MNGEAWGIADADALVAAIDKELEELAQRNAALVAKGRLKLQEAEFHSLLVGDIRLDLAHAFGPLALDASYTRAEPGVGWHDKVRWISAELDERRARYPDLVAKGRMTEADAARRIRTVEQLRRLYWNAMFQWLPLAGPALDYVLAVRRTVDPARREALWQGEQARIYRQQIRDHLLQVDQESGAAQGVLAA